MNLFLMSGLGSSNWARLIVWLAIGLIIYFSYGRKHGRVQNAARPQLNTYMIE
jgi:APA family basic amino acid/polyamine antiporter